MEGTEFYDVTFAVEDDKEISIVLELNPENSAVVVIDEVLEPTRDTLARDEVEGRVLFSPREHGYFPQEIWKSSQEIYPKIRA